MSGEFDENAKHPLIIFMPEISRTHMGGTMRLGLRPTVFEPNSDKWSKVRKLYGGAEKIWERHRHRYEVNPAYIAKLTESGLEFVGKDEKGERMQVLELPGASCLRWTWCRVRGLTARVQTTRTSSACRLTPSSARARSTRRRPSSASWLRRPARRCSRSS